MRGPLAYQVLLTGAVACVTVFGVAAQSVAPPPRRVQVRGVVDGNTLVQTARRFLGVRYRLGGSTPRAFDCSGFVRYVFQTHGLLLPRTAHEQSALGRAPAPGDLQPGDLLFFYGGEGAQHIAIYTGQDSIIHASSGAKRVRIDKLAGTGMHRSWFGQRLIAVRRVLPAEGVFELPGSLAGLVQSASSVDDPFLWAAEPPLY
jgi:hypothetical protein